jgi:hypothetical protein
MASPTSPTLSWSQQSSPGSANRTEADENPNGGLVRVLSLAPTPAVDNRDAMTVLASIATLESIQAELAYLSGNPVNSMPRIEELSLLVDKIERESLGGAVTPHQDWVDLTAPEYDTDETMPFPDHEPEPEPEPEPPQHIPIPEAEPGPIRRSHRQRGIPAEALFGPGVNERDMIPYELGAQLELNKSYCFHIGKPDAPSNVHTGTIICAGKENFQVEWKHPDLSNSWMTYAELHDGADWHIVDNEDGGPFESGARVRGFPEYMNIQAAFDHIESNP